MTRAGKETGPRLNRQFTPNVVAGKTAGRLIIGPQPSREGVTYSDPYPLEFNRGAGPTPIIEGAGNPSNTRSAVYRVPSAPGIYKTPRGGSLNPPTFVSIAHAATYEADVAASRNMAASTTPAFKSPTISTAPTLNRNVETPAPFPRFGYGPSFRGSNVSHPEASVFGIGGSGPVALRQIGRGDDHRTQRL